MLPLLSPKARMLSPVTSSLCALMCVAWTANRRNWSTVSSQRVVILQRTQKLGGKTHMNGRPQSMATNSFGEVGKGEEKVELHFM